ncbi:MAG: hypothetical protein DRI99_04270 [Candidatus Aminicenantes bacterium]|nr:MAG: hypothetical protein DRJ11_02750 [Candidatus Aminicenantes bacterium]RLE04080.1 MAG: hypothetical protein DRI99_04270 [Candidatus Aminicenantes bacterium]HHF42726.1 hypothetical protein [Candidatus Aminicenantes bacterium]
MKDGKFFEIKSLSAEEQAVLGEAVKKRIEERKKKGRLTEREIEEIHQMELQPLPDIQDVQSVYEDFMYKDEEY